VKKFRPGGTVDWGYYGNRDQRLFLTAIGYRTVTGIFIFAVGIENITAT
jgi:hypothetical protein